MAQRTASTLNGDVPDNLPVISRPSQGAMLGGVCAGLARRWRVDPNLLRISVAVLAFFGGLGLAAYAGGWLLMPRDGSAELPIHRILPFTRSWSTPVVVIATLGSLLVLVSLLSGGSVGLGPVLIIGAIWFFGFRGKAVSAPPPEPTPFERAAQAWRVRLVEQHTPGYELSAPPAPEVNEHRWVQPYTDPATDVAIQDPVPLPVMGPRTPPSRRSWRLWWLALVTVVAAVGAVLVASVVFGVAAGPLAYSAAVLAGLGGTLLVATWAGRPPLLLPATILTALVTAAMMVPPMPGVGTVRQAYTGAADLPASVELGVGELDLDLSGLDLRTDRDLAIKLGAGSVTLHLPAAATSDVIYSVDAGEYRTPEVSREGTNLNGTDTFVKGVELPVLRVHVDVDVGEVEVVP